MVTMYDRSSSVATVNEARIYLFARKQKSYTLIPPTQAALLQHSKCAAYTAGCVWSQSMVSQPQPHNPADWGWIRQNETWARCWTALPPIASSCQELTKCGCRKECCGSCKCFKYGLTCTAHCNCVCKDYVVLPNDTAGTSSRV